MQRVLDCGKRVLSMRGSALDAVEATVVALEDEPLFNAGKGAYFTMAGAHELDASIMDGASRRCGAVVGVKNLKNPVRAARLVMERTPHVLLAGSSADSYAIREGCERVEQDYYFTMQAWQVLRNSMSKAGLAPLSKPAYAIDERLLDKQHTAADSATPESAGGTVGCVARDAFGNCAAATSTGGSPGKWAGRVGDAPIIGAGNLATSCCAVSCTGKGEEFIRHSIAAKVAWLVEEQQITLDSAVYRCLHQLLAPGAGGIIAVDRAGHVSMQTTTMAMPRGAADSEGRNEVAIWF